MRKIKFKAWDKKNKKMITTNLCISYDENMKINIIHNGLDVLDNVELLQFTGLKDKNGKEIYEGDIVEQIFYADEISKIIFIVEDIRKLENIYCGSSKENKVIGNIYENRELLK